MAQRPPTSAELDELAARAAAAPGGGWRKQEGGGLDHFTLRGGSGGGDLHLYAPPEAGEAVTRLLDAARADMPRLVAEVQRLRAEVEALQSEQSRRAANPVAAPAPRRSRRGGPGDRRRRRRARPRRALPCRTQGDEGRRHRSAGRLVRPGRSCPVARREGGRARAPHRDGLCREPRSDGRLLGGAEDARREEDGGAQKKK